MKRFYCPDIIGNQAILRDAERDHCIKVLRTAVGETVEIVDGRGGLGPGKLMASSKREAVIELEADLKFTPRLPLPVIAIAIPKTSSRWEYFLEKSTEIGVSAIVPILCKRSEKSRIREERSRHIILSAFKQSLHLHLPALHDITTIGDLFTTDQFSDTEKYIAHCETGKDENPFLGVLHQKGKEAIIAIGPEGDFTANEIEAALKNGFRAVSLGPSRLRVETAGIIACNIIQCTDQLT